MRENKLPSQTLPDFQQYLLSRKLVPEKSVTFHAYWANRYLTFSNRLKNADAAEALRRFLKDLQSLNMGSGNRNKVFFPSFLCRVFFQPLFMIYPLSPLL
jgi:putative flippase GtrA